VLTQERAAWAEKEALFKNEIVSLQQEMSRRVDVQEVERKQEQLV